MPKEGLTRRGFVAASLAALGARPALAQGTELRAVSRTIEVQGRAARVYGIEGPQGIAGLRLTRGERFRAELVNQLAEPTLLHWHGQTPPTEQDGVPDVSQPALQAGARYSYDFANPRTGTHWMHSHVDLQEQRLLAAPLIVRDPAGELPDEQEHVVMLHDFTFRDPAEIFAELKGGAAMQGMDMGGGGGNGMPGMDMGGGAGSDMSGMKIDGSAMKPAAGVMLNDVAFDAYLANDRTLDDPEIVTVERGGRIRLRIINGAAASNLWIDLGRLEGELIATDGNAVEAVRGSVFPLAIAQRADIRLSLPNEAGAWPILFRPEGVAMQTGLLLATPGAAIARVADTGSIAPALDLALEARLKAVKPLSPEPVTRTAMVMLTGNDQNYNWSLNGKTAIHETLFTVRPGERIAIVMRNMTGMAHPMHLHGHHFQVVDINGTGINGAMRDTVLVPPNTALTVAFDADNPGNWAFHCHHVYHRSAGMMGIIAYTSAA